MPDLETARESLQKAREWMWTTYPSTGLDAVRAVLWELHHAVEALTADEPEATAWIVDTEPAQFKVGD